jgi:hypothetical protein
MVADESEATFAKVSQIRLPSQLPFLLTEGDVFRLDAKTLVELLMRIQSNFFYWFSKPVADVHLQIAPLILATPF